MVKNKYENMPTKTLVFLLKRKSIRLRGIEKEKLQIEEILQKREVSEGG